MAAKGFIKDVVKDPPTLTPAEYWEWRNACTELWLANGKVRISELESNVLKKDTEIVTLRSSLHSATKVKTANENALSAGQQYRKIKEVLEERIGISLNNKLIDDVTYEVRDAPSDQTNGSN